MHDCAWICFRRRGTAAIGHFMGRNSRTSSTYVTELVGLGQRFASGWADTFRGRSWGTDVLAGVTVSAVALPLNVGLAIASGMPPSAGLVAGIIGGIVAAVFGSSQFQVSGPA